MEKSLIIGGSRFVGPHLVGMLLEEGQNITVFNRGNHQQDTDTVRFVRGDRHDGFSALNDEHYDVVYDMCAFNGTDTKQLIEEIDFDFLVHFGTVSSYASPLTYPIRESHPQGEWISGNYGKGKAECEEVLRSSGIKYASLRPTYVLGPNNYSDREKFIYRSLVNNRPLELPGDGRALLQFVFADEVAKSLFTLGKEHLEGAFNCSGD